MANKVGRPSSYKKKYCKMLIEHMKGGLSYECFGAVIGHAKQTIYNWEKEHKEFLDAKRLAFNESRLFWERAGLGGMYMGGKENPFNATVWVFNMKNRFNWSDRTHVEQEQKVELSMKKYEDMDKDELRDSIDKALS